MKQDKDLCPECFHLVSFEIDGDDFFETDEGETITEVKCPHCGADLEVFFELRAVLCLRSREE